MQQGVAKTLTEVTSIRVPKAERVLEDVRILALGGNLMQLEPKDTSHVDLTWMQMKLIKRIRAVVIELKNWFAQDSSRDSEDTDVAHDARCVRLVLFAELRLAVDDGSKANRHIQWKHRDVLTIHKPLAKLLVRTASVRNAPRRLRFEFTTPCALRCAAHRKNTKRTDELIITKRLVLGRDYTEIPKAREPSQVCFGGSKRIAKRKHVRADYNLKVKLCEEQCAPQDLVSKALVRKVVTKSIEHRLRVQVRVERGVEIQRHEVPIRVPSPQIPHDTSRSFDKAVLPNDDCFALGQQLTRNRQACFVQLHHSNDRP